ncbi:DNA repair protein XRCC1 [Rhincodon typus]|uniref:DNA repair protein XRCC1 n=1 Tax=Rhincodon typus TaxID=259920 RepID=UPI00203054AA|nr:DNA repair protein XRCC1 [Rhincodon typus]
MPEIKLQHVVSCSSEDTVSITSIHYPAVILVSSFFMSPTESRNGTPLNRVRMFGPDKLAKATLAKKWDRVKVVCTQPYNKLQQPTPVKRKFEFPKERMGSLPVKKESPGEGSESTSKKTSPPLSTTKRIKAEPNVSPPPLNAGPLTPSQPGASRKAASLQKKAKKHRKGAGEPVEFHRILEGTIFVLSGFQNPFRSELRDKALEMGAKYRSDWSPDSTHLICAFANTPKYTQVKSQGGCVVRKDWILDCYKKKQRLSHKRWLPNLVGLFVCFLLLPVTGKSFDDDSGCDTEDELKRVQEYHQKQLRATKEEVDPYAGSTDENTDVEESVSGDVDLPIPELPDLFLGKHFLLYGEFPDGEHRMLSRYITAFNGALEEYMNDSVNYVITAEEWDDRFDEALMENSNLAFVKPRWVYVCNEKQKMVPHQPYVVVPQL